MGPAADRHTDPRDPAHPKLVGIVVPCYNEAARLDVQAFAAAQSDGYALHFVFVDDGSTDDTRIVIERIRALRPESVTVVACKVNAGKAEAVRRGMLRALAERPEFVGYWDADLATPLEEIARFVDVFRRHSVCRYVLGSRVRLLGRNITRNPWRHYSGRVFATAASLTLDMPVYDTQCGAKLFRAGPEVAEAFATPFLTQWVFDVELIARLRRAHRDSADGLRGLFYELPLRRWEDIKDTRLRMRDVIRAATDLRTIWKTYRRTR